MHTDALLLSRQYADLDAKLTGRCSQSRKVANNTYLQRRGDDIAVRLHNTDVVTFHADGTATLSTGGWFTVTTKARINDYLPGGIALSSVRGRWFLTVSMKWGSPAVSIFISRCPRPWSPRWIIQRSPAGSLSLFRIWTLPRTSGAGTTILCRPPRELRS